MKYFIFNIQSKGGAGKSMLTYLQALKNENNEKTLFVDLDNSTKTSLKQLQFLSVKKRIAEVSINDNKRRIDREKLFDVIEKLAALEPFETIFIDFGAPESQQFPSLFNLDFSAGELKDFETALDAKFVFNVIVAGGASYVSCMEFTHEVSESLKGLFDVNIWLNEYSFTNYESLIDEVKQYADANKEVITSVRVFGNIETDRSSGQNIIQSAKSGRGNDGFVGFATRAVIKRELAKV